MEDWMNRCTLCPRRCGADRTVSVGRCGVGEQVRLARAALHFWEEPCVSGEEGSGTVFFSGCSLGCVFCQNYQISAGHFGRDIPVERLAEIFLELQEQKANNINLVTGGHYIPQIVRALDLVRGKLHIPGLQQQRLRDGGGAADAQRLRGRLPARLKIPLPRAGSALFPRAGLLCGGEQGYFGDV